MDFDFDLTKVPLPLSGPGVHSDPVVGDLSKPLAVAAADLDGRAVGAQVGGALQRAGSRVGTDQISDLSWDRVRWAVERDLAAAEH